MERHSDTIRAAGLRTVAVGLGQPKHARRYCPALAPSATCVCGQGAEAHKRYGLRQGSWSQLVGAGVMRAGMRAAASGYRQGRATGDERILEGTFVVDERGVIQHAFYSRFAGDHIDLEALLEAMGAQPASAQAATEDGEQLHHADV